MKILVLLITFAFSACQKSAAENNVLPAPQSVPSVSPASDSKPKPAQALDSSIRKVDFKNFTYHQPNSSDETLILKNGKKEKTEKEDGADLEKIEYGDVTGDNREEAMISVLPVTGGNCQCEMVFIYTSENGAPKLLWSFDTWDRADDGLKRVYAESGELIVETFGDNKFENDKWEFSLPKQGAGGLCCPTAFTKIRFKWNGEKFAAEGKPEIFDYDFKNQINKN